MKVDVFMLEFVEKGGMSYPTKRTEQIHTLAVQYAHENLAVPVNFSDLRNIWVAAEVDEAGKPTRVLGLLGMVLKPDFPLCRFTDNAAVVKLVDRARAFLQDSFSARGSEAFIFISAEQDDTKAMRCVDWDKWIKAYSAAPAERYRITI